MKIVAIAVIFAAIAVLNVTSETCTGADTSTCTALSCTGNFHEECVNGICTCSTNIQCTMQSDCTDGSFGSCNRGWHCVDNICRCGGNFGK